MNNIILNILSFSSNLAALDAATIIYWALGLVVAFVALAVIVTLLFYRKVEKGTAIVRTGWGGTAVYFNGGKIIPVLHRAELIDISLKRVEIDRTGKNGLICQDNMRADIKVAFFVRVNNAEEDVLHVAGAIGCE